MFRGKPGWRNLLPSLILASVAAVSFVATSHSVADETQKVSNRQLLFSERVAAGGPNDFMTVRHLKLRGSNRAIGRKLAEIAQTRHGLRLRPADPSAVKRRVDFYEKHYPTHYQRVLGVAEWFGVGLDGAVDPSLLPYNVGRSPQCSVVFCPASHSANGHAMLSRNYDFSTGTWAQLMGRQSKPGARATTEDPYVMEIYPDNGYASLSMCAYEMLGGCLDGVNAKGLTVALLANQSQSDSQPATAWKRGLSVTEIARYVLETCATAAEARRALKSIEFYYTFIPCHYIISDISGDSFVWEYTNDRRKRFTIDGGDGPQWVTNHALFEYPSVKDIPIGMSDRDSFYRYKRLASKMESGKSKKTVKDLREATHCVKATGGSGILNRTLWHGIYDCNDRSLAVDFYLGEDPSAKDGEKRSGYLEFALED